jgi:ABC-type nitrate/sulfonate/bicarbonate transport system substrate-binding protein
MMNTRVRRVVGSFFALILWAGFAADGRAAELMPVRASYAAIGGVFAPLWIAQEHELFAKYDAAVDLKFMPSVVGTQALIAKSLDVVAPSGEFMEAALSGERVVYIAGIANKIVLSMYSKPEIRSVSDLRGKVVSALSPGSTSDVLARILLQEANLTLGRDVQMLYIKSGPEILAALNKGVIDAGIISAPMTLKARQAGFNELVNAGQKNIPMIHSALGTTRDFLRDHPERLRAFLQGYTAAISFAKTNPEETKRVIGKYTKTNDQEDLQETYQTFVNVWERVPYISPAAVQNVLNFAKHPAAKNAKPEQFIDNSTLAGLEKSGFINQLYQR